VGHGPEAGEHDDSTRLGSERFQPPGAQSNERRFKGTGHIHSIVRVELGHVEVLGEAAAPLVCGQDASTTTSLIAESMTVSRATSHATSRRVA
jgi:hypothetical protein